ncbi:MAG TPA: phosphate ABC transporter ATP-binding protein [Acidimicrobiales bacterium]|nr:phosphate ABC transporter ATP-binding protein [Acidimicrobiales bacterium]
MTAPTRSGPPLFDLVGVTLDIDGAVVLDHVDLTVPEAGITVVVGPSGAGKSMLLRLLNRLEVPTAGEVRFRGEPVATLDPLTLRRRVGMVFQRPAPFPGTVRDNLAVADPRAGDDAYGEALRSAGLDPSFLDRDADELSGGEAQRMCLARTLVTGPEALLMDEPTSALDPDARRRLERTAHRLAEGGRPLVWVTHDLDQCGRLADTVVVLVSGRVATDAERARFLAAGGVDGEDHTDDDDTEEDADEDGDEDADEDGEEDADTDAEEDGDEDGAARDRRSGDRPAAAAGDDPGAPSGDHRGGAGGGDDRVPRRRAGAPARGTTSGETARE